MSILILILGVILFLCLVLVHEWGHFIAARRAGVEIEEFAIGFPPRIWKKRMPSGFDLSVNLLPLGGFVRLKGEHDADKSPGSFGAATLAQKTRIMLAGVVMNLLTAFVLLTILALVGLPTLFNDQFTVKSDTKIVQSVKNADKVLVTRVVAGAPADKAGLKEGDQIISFAGEAITDPGRVGELAKANAGKNVDMIVVREGAPVTLPILVNSDNNSGNGFIGVVSSSGAEGIELRRSTWSAPVVAGGLMGQFTGMTYRGLSAAVSGLFRGDTKTAGEQVAGPVGVFAVLKNGSTLGFSFMLMIIAIISLTLALMNILPIPALDGGRLFVTLLFRAIRQPLTQKREELINGAGFVFLMALFVVITIVDIKRL